MRLVPVQQLHDDAVLAREVRAGAPGTVPLLRVGAQLTAPRRESLRRRGITAVWIDDGPLSDGVAPVDPLPAGMRDHAQATVISTLATARKRLDVGRRLSDDDVSDLAKVADSIAAHLIDAPAAVYALNEMSTSDQYTHEHSVRVCTLGVLLASRHWRRHGWTDYRGKPRFDGIERLLSQLGLGLLTHDIGKLAIDRAILDKPGILTDEERAEIERHPTLGREMLAGTEVSMVSLGVIEGHHERWDGAGYPKGLDGARIQDFAAIAAIADTYDAVCSVRTYKPAQPPHVGVRIVREGAGTQFNPAMVQTFCELVMPFPVGHQVLLPDGREAVVVAVDPTRPYQPLVRTRGAGGIVEVEADLSYAAGAPEPAAPAALAA
jgi:HD-GYP domain-containing protein (c-di-GMP phosphodiesterase class II)